jgi:hypothetical protein
MMVDMTAIGVVSTSLNTAINIVKAMQGVHDATIIDGKVFELQRAILDTQQSVFAANQERASLIEHVRELEKEISDLRQWDAEKNKYELIMVDSTWVYAYSRKPIPGDAQPHHFICTNCYENGKKSLLQATHHLAMRKRVHVCPLCKMEIAFGYTPPERPARAISEYNPFA